jgi:hypothetical protein
MRPPPMMEEQVRKQHEISNMRVSAFTINGDL